MERPHPHPKSSNAPSPQRVQSLGPQAGSFGKNTTAEIHTTPEAAHSHSRLVRNPKGTRMQHKHRSRRLGRVMRWGVYACTLVVLVVTALSFFFVFGAAFSKVRQEQILLYTEVSVEFEKGRVDVELIPGGGYEMFNPLPEPGWYLNRWGYKTKYYKYPKGSIFAPKYQWWSLPGYTHGHGIPTGPTKEVSIPFVYLSVILSGLSMWVWIRVHKRNRLGRCVHCGYSLADLPTITCPECGVDHG